MKLINCVNIWKRSQAAKASISINSCTELGKTVFSWEYQKIRQDLSWITKARYLHKVYINDARITFMELFWFLHCWLWTSLCPFTMISTKFKHKISTAVTIWFNHGVDHTSVTTTIGPSIRFVNYLINLKSNQFDTNNFLRGNIILSHWASVWSELEQTVSRLTNVKTKSYYIYKELFALREFNNWKIFLMKSFIILWISSYLV